MTALVEDDNYKVGPFLDADGKPTQVTLNADGSLPIASAAVVGGAVTVADGADANAGTTTDAAVTAGNSGTESAKLRAISRDLGALLALTPPATTKVASVQTASSGSTAILTSASEKKFRLTGYILSLSAEAEKASAGLLTVKLLDVAASMGIEHKFYVPGTSASANPGHFTTGFIPLGRGLLQAAANTALNVNLSAALTAGNVCVTVVGDEE